MSGSTQPRVTRPRIQDGYGIPESLEGTLAWSWAEERLAAARLYWVASTRPDGRPHAMPTWGAWVDDVFWMEGGAQTRRMRNLAREPAAVVHLERGDDVVIVEGVATQVHHLDDDLRLRLVQGFHKYIASHDYRVDPALWEGGGIWSVRPRVVFGWSRFPYDTTRWIFGDG